MSGNFFCINPYTTQRKTMSRLTDKVQELVANNKVEEALDCMIKFFRTKDSERLNSCIELKRQFNMFEKENALDKIDDNIYNLNINRISTAVIDIVTEIDDGRWADIVELDDEPIKKTNSFRNAIQVDKLTKRDWMLGGLGTLSLIVFFIWMFKPPQQNVLKEDKPIKSEMNILPVTPPLPAIIKSAADMYEEARILRNNDKFEEAIKLCDTILLTNKCHWKSFNLIAECLINIHTQKSKDDHSPELRKARDNAYEALKCNTNDEGGYINSTLAQIFGLEENDKKFFFHTEKALQKGLRIWEFDYKIEPGFSNYAKNAHFLQLIKDYRNPSL